MSQSEINNMDNQKNNNIDNKKNIKPQEVVSIPVSLSKSIQGKYFVGQTEPMFVSASKIAWASLVNPCHSRVNLFTNVFTISNFSDSYLTAEIWLNADLPENLKVSHLVSPTNTALHPRPKNRVDIKYGTSSIVFPKEGINVYERIVPPNTTLVGEEDGKFIEAPGGNYTLIIKSSSCKLDKVVVAFGWWEEKK